MLADFRRNAGTARASPYVNRRVIVPEKSGLWECGWRMGIRLSGNLHIPKIWQNGYGSQKPWVHNASARPDPGWLNPARIPAVIHRPGMEGWGNEQSLRSRILSTCRQSIMTAATAITRTLGRYPSWTALQGI